MRDSHSNRKAIEAENALINRLRKATNGIPRNQLNDDEYQIIQKLIYWRKVGVQNPGENPIFHLIKD